MLNISLVMYLKTQEKFLNWSDAVRARIGYSETLYMYLYSSNISVLLEPPSVSTELENSGKKRSIQMVPN